MKEKMDLTGMGKPGADAVGAFRDSATAEELALARALEACEVPPVPKEAVMAIHLRVQAEAAARRQAWRRAWCGVWAAAAAVALLLGAWGVLRQTGDGVGEFAAVEEAAAEEKAYAEAEEEWISPYAEEFEALETTLLAFEALDFGSDDASAFPSL